MGACYPERAQNTTATTDVDTPPNQNESPKDRPVGARDGGLQNSSDAEQLDAGLPLGVPTTAEVYDNFAPLCSACHNSGQSFPIFASLTDFENLVVNNEDWIVAGNPQSSILLALLEGTSDGAYAQMPPGPNTYFDMTAGDATLLGRTALEQWITFLNPDSTSEAECWDAPAFRGLQRLTRTEYNNTVRDLLGDTEAPGNTFPADDYSHGFDNIAEVLTLSPLLVEKYELAAQSLIDNALTLESTVPVDTLEEAENLIGSVGAAGPNYWNLWSNGTLTIVFSVATEGDYTLSFRGGGQQAGPVPFMLTFFLDNQNVYGTQVPEAWPNANIYQRVVHLMPGTHSFGVEFTNDYYCPSI